MQYSICTWNSEFWKVYLLNSIFGLNFSVSAGRCTSGVFLKLLRVNKKEKEKYKMANDLMMIIDTEGLRSPELFDAKKRDQRDNELAALSVGLGKMSLINMFGENMSDLKDEDIQGKIVLRKCSKWVHVSSSKC